MYTLITVLIVLASIALILVVLVQNSKGGGLASSFSSSNQVMGVRKTTDFVEKATWGLAGFVVVLSLVSVMFLKGERQDTIDSQILAPTLPMNATPDVSTGLPFDEVITPEAAPEE